MAHIRPEDVVIELGDDELDRYVEALFLTAAPKPPCTQILLPVDDDTLDIGQVVRVLTDVAVRGLAIRHGPPSRWSFAAFDESIRRDLVERMAATGYLIHLDSEPPTTRPYNTIRDRDGVILYVSFTPYLDRAGSHGRQ